MQYPHATFNRFLLVAVLFAAGLAEAAVTVIAAEPPLKPGPGLTGGGSMGVGGTFGRYGYGDRTFEGYVMQTFVAEESGYLRSVSLVVQNHSDSPVGDPLVVSLVSILGDEAVPTESVGNVLVTSSVPNEDLQDSSDEPSPYLYGYNTTVTYTGEALMIAGERYGLRIGASEQLGSHLRIWKSEGSALLGTDYSAGVLLDNDIDGLREGYGDLFFRVEVQSVPEVRMSLFVTLALGVMVFRRMK